jgi:hypothetical protein
MRSVNATKFHRKSGVSAAEGSAVRLNPKQKPLRVNSRIYPCGAKSTNCFRGVNRQKLMETRLCTKGTASAVPKIRLSLTASAAEVRFSKPHNLRFPWRFSHSVNHYLRDGQVP